MAYELFIFEKDGTPKTTPPQIVAAFESAGQPCTEEPDEFGHWLVLEGYESALNLTVKGGSVTDANLRVSPSDDPAIIDKVVDVFKNLGWSVGDDEGEL